MESDSSWHDRASGGVDGLMARLGSQLRPLLDASEALGKDPRCSERFPRIVVVGDQSDGKSTVLEAISRVKFPRSSGLCTRCPIQLSLRRGDEESLLVSYSINGKAKKKEGHIRDFERMILEAQEDLTSGLDFPICEDIIEVLVQSPESFDLTLVDLPGINRKDDKYHDKTVQIIKRYIESSQTIIIVVFKATTDIEVVQGFELAKKVDPMGDRTFGVMTFCDALTDSTEESVQRLLNGQTPQGIAVRSVFPVACDRVIKSGFESETEVFEGREVFRRLTPEKCGTRALVTRLSREVLQRLKPWTDQIHGLVKEKHTVQQQLLKGLLRDQPTQADSSYARACELLQELALDYAEHITGTHRHQKNVLYSECNRRFADYRESVHRATDDLDQNLIRVIQSEYVDQRGREFPIATNIFPIIERITGQLIDQYQRPTEDMYKAVSEIVEVSLTNTTARVFQDYPQLMDFMLAELNQLSRECQETASERLDDLLQMEKTIVFSLNPRFSTTLDWDPQMGMKSYVQDTLEQQGTTACRPVQTSADPCKPEQTCPEPLTGPWQILRADPSEPEQTNRRPQFRHGKNRADPSRQVQTSADPSRPVQTSADPSRPVQTSADEFRSVHTNADQPVEFKSSSVESEPKPLDWDQKRLYYLTKSYLHIVRDRVVDSVCMTLLKYLNHGLARKMKSVHSLLPERHRVHFLMQDPKRDEKIRVARIEMEKWRRQEENLARICYSH